jgi:hypothetical protein
MCYLILGMYRISGRIIWPYLRSGIRPDTGFDGRISRRILQKAGYPARYPANLLTVTTKMYQIFMKTLQLVFGNKNFPFFKF